MDKLLPTVDCEYLLITDLSDNYKLAHMMETFYVPHRMKLECFVLNLACIVVESLGNPMLFKYHYQ